VTTADLRDRQRAPHVPRDPLPFRGPDDGSEPPQIYGSGPVEFAWTAVPVLIVFVLILVTARSIYSVQAVRRPASRARGARRRPPGPHADLPRTRIRDVAHSFWVPRLAGDRPHPSKTNVTAGGLPLRLREVTRLGGLGPLDDQVAAGAIMWSPAR